MIPQWKKAGLLGGICWFLSGLEDEPVMSYRVWTGIIIINNNNDDIAKKERASWKGYFCENLGISGIKINNNRNGK